MTKPLLTEATKRILRNQARWLISVEVAYQNQVQCVNEDPNDRALFQVEVEKEVDQEYADYLSELYPALIEVVRFTDTGPDDEAASDIEFSQELETRLFSDMEAFFLLNLPDCLTAMNHPDYALNRIAHDFWYSRNGHGTGFWDRGLGELGERLHKAADEAFGVCDTYVGDDGRLYA